MTKSRISLALRVSSILGVVLLAAGCARYYDRSERIAGAPPTATPTAPAEVDEAFSPVPPVGARQIPVPASGTHEVVRGNTVYSISRLYGVPVRAIIEANRLTPPYLLKVGNRLRISAPRIHRVAKGETVYSISRRYGVPMNELTRTNGIRSPYTISVGQELTIPAESVQVAEAPAPAQPSGAAPSARAVPRQERPTPKQVAALPNPPARTGKLFNWPVSGEVVVRFGRQTSGRHNDGINIKAARGTTIMAAESGVVAYAGNELRGFGNLLLIKHADGFMTAYAHTDSLLVTRGQTVKRGQAIARVGSSGSVASPQLHFEIRKGRKAVDPLRYLPKSPQSS